MGGTRKKRRGGRKKKRLKMSQTPDSRFVRPRNAGPPPRASTACVWVVLSATYTTVARLSVSYPLRALFFFFFPSSLRATGSVGLLPAAAAAALVQQKVRSLPPVLARTTGGMDGGEERKGGPKKSDLESVIHGGILSAKSRSVIIKLTNLIPLTCSGMMYASF